MFIWFTRVLKPEFAPPPSPRSSSTAHGLCVCPSRPPISTSWSTSTQVPVAPNRWARGERVCPRVWRMWVFRIRRSITTVFTTTQTIRRCRQHRRRCVRRLCLRMRHSPHLAPQCLMVPPPSPAQCTAIVTATATVTVTVTVTAVLYHTYPTQGRVSRPASMYVEEPVRVTFSVPFRVAS